MASFINYFYNEFILTVIIVLHLFTYYIIELLIYFITYLLLNFMYLLLISLADELGFLEALFYCIFIIISHFVFTCKFKLIMNILNMYVLQCIYVALSGNFTNKIIIIINNVSSID